LLKNFGSKNPEEILPRCRTFKMPNTEKVIENGKKAPLKYRDITLCSLVENMQTDSFTASGWPSVSGLALKSLAGKIPTELIYMFDEEGTGEDSEIEMGGVNDEDEDSQRSMYGAAYDAFGGRKKGKEACHAIAALCEMCSIDSLISNFILPLQVC
jgi:DNA polymerase I